MHGQQNIKILVNCLFTFLIKKYDTTATDEVANRLRVGLSKSLGLITVRYKILFSSLTSGRL